MVGDGVLHLDHSIAITIVIAALIHLDGAPLGGIKRAAQHTADARSGRRPLIRSRGWRRVSCL